MQRSLDNERANVNADPLGLFMLDYISRYQAPNAQNYEEKP